MRHGNVAGTFDFSVTMAQFCDNQTGSTLSMRPEVRTNGRLADMRCVSSTLGGAMPCSPEVNKRLQHLSVLHALNPTCFCVPPRPLSSCTQLSRVCRGILRITCRFDGLQWQQQRPGCAFKWALAHSHVAAPVHVGFRAPAAESRCSPHHMPSPAAYPRRPCKT